MKMKEIETTINCVMFTSKQVGTKKKFFKEDYKECYEKLGKWLTDKTKHSKFIGVSNVNFHHSYDYNLNLTYLQLELFYESY